MLVIVEFSRFVLYVTTINTTCVFREPIILVVNMRLTIVIILEIGNIGVNLVYEDICFQRIRDTLLLFLCLGRTVQMNLNIF